EQFSSLSAFVSQKLAGMAEQILQGNIDVMPCADRSGSACDYCIYSDVCGFDRRIPGMRENRLPAMTKDEVWEKIERESCERKE
ncbi:MAG: hypothetical protein SOX32_00980, partial [Candidatus Choladocola sp.]|nr:hypothetical protein [Candidatus Choladocola sp.]